MYDAGETLLIGVDGGGSGCRVAIGTRAQGVLGCADGGQANATTDPDSAIKNIISTVQAAAAKAGIAPAKLNDARAHLGLAGVITPADAQRIASALPYAESVVTDDRATTVTGALCGEDGYLLSVGTGTIIAASAPGAFRYVGGWGFRVSDQASGAWLGRAALEQVLLCHDGLAAHGTLTKAVFAQFNNDPHAIVAFSTTAEPRAFATLAPNVVTMAENGDPWCCDIMQAGADYLMRGLSRLGFQPGDRLCLTGGVGPHYAPYLPPDARAGLHPARGSALDGAFALAISADTTVRGTL